MSHSLQMLHGNHSYFGKVKLENKVWSSKNTPWCWQPKKCCFFFCFCMEIIHFGANMGCCWISYLTSQLTIFQWYMWRHIDVQADSLRSGSQRHRHFVEFFYVAVQAPTWDQPFYPLIPNHRPNKSPFTRRWGYGGHILDLTPGPHGGKYGRKIIKLVSRSATAV